MKKRILAMMAIAATLCACNKVENTAPEVQTPEDNAPEVTAFTATFEGAGAKATLDGMTPSWEVGDAVNINGTVYYAKTAGTSTTFPVQEIRPKYVSSTDTGSYQNQPAKNLVDDGGVDTRWIANKTDMADGVWNIVVTTGDPTRLAVIKLWNADNQSYPGRRWKSMKVYGSASASGEWTEIASFENLDLEANNKGLAGEIAINATEYYSFYKIDVLDNEGASDGYMQMSDMKFLAYPQAPFTACFPANLKNGTKFTLPSSEEHYSSNLAKFLMPMCAQSNTHELQFKNLCAVLKIVVKNDVMDALHTIKVSSSNKAISGDFTIVDDTAVLVNPDAVQNTYYRYYDKYFPIKITSEGVIFYVALPAQTYRELRIDLISDGHTKSMTTKKGVDIVVERNKMYQIVAATTENSDSYVLSPVDLNDGDFE